MFHKLRRRAYVLFFIILIGFVTSELVARYRLGLGDPPLVVADPDMAYVFAPSRTYIRFGNVIHYNAFSMRSDDFPQHKSNANERRVLFIGNSIINGGALTDQSHLATTLLQQRLRSTLNRNVWVGNVSAGGWGPESEWAYAKRYGFFDADLVVIVLTDGDYHNIRQYLAGTDPNFPTKRPALAVEEAFIRYLPQYLRIPKFGDDGFHREEAFTAEEKDRATFALRQLVIAARTTGAQVFLVQHVMQHNPDRRSFDVLRAIAENCGASFISLESAFRTAQQQGISVYRDSIHPNDNGQELIANVLFPFIEAVVTQEPKNRTVDNSATQGHEKLNVHRTEAYAAK